MRLLHCLVVITLSTLCLFATAQATEPAKSYGENAQSGKYAQINGIRIYYEIYGDGEPLLLIHGSGQSIEAMKYQIAYFAKTYRVIVADNRAHGKTDTGEGRLTYEQMADDSAALLNLLDINSASILGWSDGGNVGLLLAIRHPDKIKKLAIMGANFRPGSSAVYPWAIEWVASESGKIEDMLAKGDKTQDWQRLRQQFGLLREQPNISLEVAAEITTPVLVMAGDRDIIRAEHTLLMFQTLPNSQLAIFPGETHYAPHNHPDLFNGTVDRFFRSPFSKPDTRDLF